jgi:hypothetical protein
LTIDGIGLENRASRLDEFEASGGLASPQEASHSKYHANSYICASNAD